MIPVAGPKAGASYSVEELQALSTTSFAEVVDRELHGRLDARTRRSIEHPDVLDRWHSQLNQMMQNSILSLLAKDAESSADRIEAVNPEIARDIEVAHLRLRAKALRFQSVVQQRLFHVEFLARDQEARTRVVALEDAIRRHLEESKKASQSTPAINSRLWAVLPDT